MLANLFMHYAFDQWLAREHPDVVFERYADDAVVHCVSETRAHQVLAGIADRMGVSLAMRKSPQVAICKDRNRPLRYERTAFTFLGYTFRPRAARDRQGRAFLVFLPAISKQALKKISREVRRWRLHRRIYHTFGELARTINPIVAGWMQYYGRFYPSAKVVLVQMGEAKMLAKRSASVTPIKGLDHESKLHEVLEAISADHGDGYVRTGATTGALGSSKKGDGVVTMHDVAGSSDSIANMVVEMHNSDTMVRDWSEYLDVAIRNRKAQVALGIVRTQDQLPGGEALRMWGCRKIVVAFDPDTDDPALLRAVYLLLRAQACLSAARNGIDQVQTAEEQLRAAAEQLTQFAELQKMVTTIKTNADKTVLKLGGLQETLARHVTAALAALREAGGSEATSAAA